MDTQAHTLPGGLLVMFEGIDGSGKTTQIQLLEEELQRQDWNVTVSRNPGGTPIGEALRSVMKSPLPRPAMADLYISVAVQEALIELITAEREKGSIILMDRSPLSIAAYQIYGGGIDETTGWKYVETGMGRFKPDLVILYECDPQQALERARQTSTDTDYFESKPLSYFERVVRGYDAAAERYTVSRIDARQPIEAVHSQTMDLVNQILTGKTSSVA